MFKIGSFEFFEQFMEKLENYLISSSIKFVKFIFCDIKFYINSNLCQILKIFTDKKFAKFFLRHEIEAFFLKN